MKFSIPVYSIRRVISLIRDVVPSRSVSQEGTGILMDVSEKRVVFSAVGSDLLIRVADSTVSVEEAGRAVVNSAMFSEIVNTFSPVNEENIGTETLTLSSNVRNKSLSIVSTTNYKSMGKVKNKRAIPLLNSELFQAIPKFNKEEARCFPGEVLIDAISKVIPSASGGYDSGVLSGVYVRCSSGVLTCTATDGIRLSEYSMEGVEVDSSFETVIPTKFALKVSRAINPKETVRVLLDGPIFWVSGGGVLVGGYTINGSYPDYKQFLKTPTNEVVIDGQMFNDNIKNLDFGDVEDNRIDFSFDKNMLNMSTKHAENDGIPVDFSGAFDVSFNIKLLKALAKPFEGSSLKMGFSDSSSIVFFSPSEVNKVGETFMSVLMPLSR